MPGSAWWDNGFDNQPRADNERASQIREGKAWITQQADRSCRPYDVIRFDLIGRDVLVGRVWRNHVMLTDFRYPLPDSV